MDMAKRRPLILFTNDDGVRSPGLLAVVSAFVDIADVLVVAPLKQQSGTGRSLPLTSTAAVDEHSFMIEGVTHTFYGVDGTPAQAVQQAVLEIAKRRPSLVVSGINYGENCGNGVTISGTVGAALEAASLGIPAIAVSQQTPKNLHLTYSTDVDFSVAAQVTRRFGMWLMRANGRTTPHDIDLLKIDVPMGATLETSWRMTRQSRTRVYWPAKREKAARTGNPLGYYEGDTSRAEPDSDVYAVFQDKVISVTPMSLDMTSRVDMDALRGMIEEEKTIAR
jgi:5'-nucleotidase